MITVAVANLLESSEQALQFIYQTSKIRGLKVESISPNSNIIYKHRKKIPLKRYVREIEQKKECDLLIVELSREAMKKQVYENLEFNIAVFFNKGSNNNKNKMTRVYVSNQLLKCVKANYYILPDKYKKAEGQTITYGWSKTAHICATSAQRTVNGQTQMQCCVGAAIPLLNGTQSQVKEFTVASYCQNIEGILAGIATLVIYGIDLGEY